MGSDSAFSEPFYKEVPHNSKGKIDIPVGTKVKLQGRHCIVAKAEFADCLRCVLHGMEHFDRCSMMACQNNERDDGIEVYFKEIVE